MRLRIALLPAATAGLMGLAPLGCGHDTSTLPPAPPNTDPIVFGDAYGSGCTFQAFLGSKLDAVTVDMTEKYQGTASLKVTVPPPGNPDAGYAGGAFTTNLARDLTGYNALTFWAKASSPGILDVAGLGNDNTGTSKYEAQWKDVPITQTWKQFVVPIPFPARLASEQGLFFFAEGPENGMGYDVYFDEIQFATVAGITNPRPSMTSKSVSTFVGAQVNIEGAKVVFNVNGADQTVLHSPAYFNFTSSNEAVAKVVDGVIQAMGGGSAEITAKLDTVAVAGIVTLNVTAPPAVAAPTPTIAPANVVSLFSNAYSAADVDTWSAVWDAADVVDAQIAGNDVKTYTNLIFAGIEFTSHPIDATSMTHFHLDLWIPEGTLFKVKLVDFGADGVYGGGDDREHELPFDAASTPALVTGAWVGLEIPLANFTTIANPGHLAQLILSGDCRTAYVDNVYFHR